jgi:hypothetical protein
MKSHTVPDIFSEESKLLSHLAQLNTSETKEVCIQLFRLLEHLRFPSQGAAILSQLDEVMAGGFTVSQITQRVVDAAQKLVQCERTSIFEIQPNSGVLICHRDSLVFSKGCGIAGHCASFGKINIPDWASQKDRFSGCGPAEDSLRSVLAIPILDPLTQDPVAVLEFRNSVHSGGFSVEEEAILNSLATSASVGIRNARDSEMSLYQRESTERLLRAMETLATISANNLVPSILNAAVSLFPVDGAFLFLLDSQAPGPGSLIEHGRLGRGWATGRPEVCI